MAEFNRPQKLLDKIALLRQKYVYSLPKEMFILNKIIASSNLVCNEKIIQLNARLHKLAGTGGSFGFTNLTDKARELEYFVAGFEEALGPQLPENERLDEISKKLKSLEVVINNILKPGPSNAQTQSQILSTETPQNESITDEKKPEKALIALYRESLHLDPQIVAQLESFGFITKSFSDIAELEAYNSSIKFLLIEKSTEQGETDLSFSEAEQNYLKNIDIPFFIISDSGNFSSRVLAAKLKASGFYVKPIDELNLIEQIRKNIDNFSAKPERILIIDDDHGISKVCQKTLETEGMIIKLLDKPQNLINEMIDFSPELVLMDLYMPNFSGIDLARVIRQHESWSSLPIVFLSGESDLDKQITAINQGGDDFLVKPVHPAQLICSIRTKVARSRELNAQISSDSLTGLFKHAIIKDSVDVEISRAARHHYPVSVAIIDLDHFKSINDQYGHLAGDTVISAISMLLKQRLRKSDIIGRYGGEEFLVVLPECDASNAELVIDEVRESFSNIQFHADYASFSCTLSAGIATYIADSEITGAQLIGMADNALYQSKNAGRNCLTIINCN